MNPEKPTILAIDDTPANLMMLGAALAGEFDLRIAASGSEGLATAARVVPDLILLDVMMPELDGIETCRRLKADPALRDIPVIFITALADFGSELAGLNVGAVEYIAKPFRIDLVRQRIRNILQLARLNRELADSEERLRYVMEATGDGIWDWDIDSGMVSHNHAWCRVLGLEESLLRHPVATFESLVHPDDLPAVREAIEACLAGSAPYASEHRMRHGDGGYVWVSDRGDVVRRDADGRPRRMVGCVKNIDELKLKEAEIHRLAFYDPLTGLPNRRLLTDRLQQSWLANKRHGGFGVLMFLDMDRFKQLNDTYGHAMGDQLLVQVAARLQQCVREQDTVARFGGDEFVVMLDRFSGTPEAALGAARNIGEKIRAALNAPYRLGDMAYASTPSIGLCLFDGREANADEVLKRADIAMYAAKSAGRNTLRVFGEAEQSDFVL
ncbi:diguanylate cyclase domain-containing protein [Azonexus sp.]|uniref:diguanylate cyclase domain-containing protein n=1 Tax=Azonexus sp. TaxID=1872668 RepID=UPI0035AF29A4